MKVYVSVAIKTKQELMKKCNEIILATNGGNDDYVVALCRISEAISKLEEPNHKECEFVEHKITGFASALLACACVDEHDKAVKCNKCGYVCGESNLRHYCPNCGAKIKEKRDE